MTQRHAVKVTFGDGDHILTEINGTEESVREYYAIGRTFNLGRMSKGEDDLQKVAALEFLPDHPPEKTGHFMDPVIEDVQDGMGWSEALARHNVD